MKNDFCINGDVTTIYLPNKLGGFRETTISTSDLKRAMEFPNVWYANFTREVNSFYVKGSLNVDLKRRKFYLHRWLLNPMPDLKIDHINHDTLNNQRNNLRICSNAENMRNTAMNYNNTSGALGVRLTPNQKKWTAGITVNGKTIRLGVFEDIRDAVTARKMAEVQYFGEFRFRGIT